MATHRIFIGSTLALCLTITLLTLSFLGERQWQYQRSDATQNFDRIYSSMGEISRKVDRDKHFNSLLESDASNSTNSYLESFIKSVDPSLEIVIRDSQCQLVASSLKGLPLTDDCTKGLGGSMEWLSHENLLFFSYKLDASQNHLEIRIPEKELLRRLSLSSTSAHSFQLSAELSQFPIVLALSPQTFLVPSSSLLILWHQWLRPVPKVLWLFWLGVFIAINLAAVSQMLQKWQTIVQSTQARVNAILSQNLDILGPLPEDIGLSLDLLGREVVELQLNQTQSIRRLEGAIQQRTQEMSEIRSQHHQSHHFKSVQAQMETHGDRFILAIEDCQSRLEDISETIHQTIFKSCRDAKIILDSWREGLLNLSARKFLRTLSERVHPNGQSQLEVELSSIFKAVDQAHHATLQARIASKQLLDHQAGSSNLARHWISLISPSNQAEHNVREVISQTQKIMMQQFEVDPDIFQNKIPATDIIGPKFPLSSWVSCLIHIYESLLSSQYPRNTIYTRVLSKPPHIFLIISSSLSKDGSERFNHDGERQLQLARQLIINSGIRLMNLSQNESEVSLALSWIAQDQEDRKETSVES